MTLLDKLSGMRCLYSRGPIPICMFRAYRNYLLHRVRVPARPASAAELTAIGRRCISPTRGHLPKCALLFHLHFPLYTCPIPIVIRARSRSRSRSGKYQLHLPPPLLSPHTHPVNSYGPSRSTTSNLYSSSTSPSSPGYVNAASNVSPATICPTPLGVPVRIRSPSCENMCQLVRRGRGRGRAHWHTCATKDPPRDA